LDTEKARILARATATLPVLKAVSWNQTMPDVTH
jgi:hypothetical protein